MNVCIFHCACVSALFPFYGCIQMLLQMFNNVAERLSMMRMRIPSIPSITNMNIIFFITKVFPDTGKGVRFSLRSAIFQNNSLVSLEDIGEWGDALLCVTDLTACCQPPYTGIIRYLLGNWFFPNGTRLRYFYPNYTSDTQWDFFRSRGHVIVYMHRRRGGVNGIYRCEIPDAMNVTQTMYIGVYTANTGEWYL